MFFVSDNGYMLGEHRMHAKGKAFEESAGIPFVVKRPGVTAGVDGTLVSQVDLMPTTLAACGPGPRRGAGPWTGGRCWGR